MRIAVLGLGFMGSMHVRAITGIPGAELAAIYSADPAKRSGDLTSIQGNLGGPGQKFDFARVKGYTAIPELLADPSIDAVDLCLPTWMHEPVAIAALQAGKHVLVEKPLALDGPSARRIVTAARQSGRILMCAQVLRFFPEYLALQQALSGLGPVRGACFARRCAEPGWGGWLKDPEKSGGGAFDLLIHDVDVCLWLFGAPRAISATGYGDWVEGHFHYDGFSAAIQGGWQPAPAFPFCMEYRITTGRGTVEFSSAGKPPVLYDTTETVLPVSAGEGYTDEISYFLECCRTGVQPDRCPPEQSAQAVECMLALLEARQGKGDRIECGNRG